MAKSNFCFYTGSRVGCAPETTGDTPAATANPKCVK